MAITDLTIVVSYSQEQEEEEEEEEEAKQSKEIKRKVKECENGGGHSLHSSSITKKPRNVQFVVVSKGKKRMMTRQFQPPTPPPLPKIEDDGNPRFVIFIRAANVCFLSSPFLLLSFPLCCYFLISFLCSVMSTTSQVFLWYPLNLVTGGTTAKIMVAAKDNFLGKYIYKETLSRNLAAVVYREGTNVRAALAPKNVIELPTPDQLKTVLDKVKDFFGDAKESFGKLTSLNTESAEEVEETSK
ncbi:hypothetical protein KSS87_022215 [Heliosperma pusillum]|nr:hypothetical protein KSS87_022215 [Heliosperma pusillum]